ncbi:MAG: hypothetical protein ACOCXA_04640 [Planctomycetota bacterium]
MRPSTPVLLLIPLLIAGCFGDPPPYPYRPPAGLRAQAQDLSDRLDAHIRAWLRGENDGSIPPDLLPDGLSTDDNTAFRLVDPDNVDPRDVWAVREAAPVDRSRLYHSLPDPNCTYLFLGTPYAPFGSRMVVTGDFPRCRFFSMQMSPSFDGETYYYNRELGAGEVAWVDHDIDPLPGHTNPFRPGADRTATERSYRVSWDLAIGDPVALNPTGAHGQPYHSREQRRTGALITAEGPWGADGSLGNGIAHGRGELNIGAVWVRYYAMDHGVDALGGVDLPRVWFELDTGERYLIVSDFSGFVERVDKTVPATETEPAHPSDPYGGPGTGWGKSFGIFHNIVGGIHQNGVSGITKEYGRDLELGMAGRGQDRTGAGHFEAHATISVNNTYLGRTSAIGPEDPWRPGSGGKVLVLTGRMPSFPNTRDGAGAMPTAELRYWSLVGYEIDFVTQLQEGTPMPATHVVMDDEVVLDAQRRYVIVYSRPEDRPANATAANGVTWIDWGPNHELSILLRWMSVAPDWITVPNPHDHPDQLPWETASWSSPDFDPGLLPNGHDGHLGDRLPQVRYLSRADFEALGSNGLGTAVPTWELSRGNGRLLPAGNPVDQLGIRLRTAAVPADADWPALEVALGPARVVTQVDASERSDASHNGLRFDGWLNAPFASMYRFQLETAGAVQLSIDGVPVIDAPAAGAVQVLKGDLGLAAGKHRVRVQMILPVEETDAVLQWAHVYMHSPAAIGGLLWSHSPGARSVHIRPDRDTLVEHLGSGLTSDVRTGFRFDGLPVGEDHLFIISPGGAG